MKQNPENPVLLLVGPLRGLRWSTTAMGARLRIISSDFDSDVGHWATGVVPGAENPSADAGRHAGRMLVACWSHAGRMLVACWSPCWSPSPRHKNHEKTRVFFFLELVRGWRICEKTKLSLNKTKLSLNKTKLSLKD